MFNLISEKKKGCVLIFYKYKYKPKWTSLERLKPGWKNKSETLMKNVQQDKTDIENLFDKSECEVKILENREPSEFTDCIESIRDVDVNDYKFFMSFVLVRGESENIQGDEEEQIALTKYADSVRSKFKDIPKFIFAQIYQKNKLYNIKIHEYPDMLVMASTSLGINLPYLYYNLNSCYMCFDLHRIKQQNLKL